MKNVSEESINAWTGSGFGLDLLDRQIAQQSMLPFYNTWNFFWTIRLWLRPALDVDFYLGAAEQRSLGV